MSKFLNSLRRIGFKSGDAVISGIALAFTLTLVLNSLFGSTKGAMVRITANESFLYPLDVSRELDIHGKLGISHVSIRDRHVSMTSSPCLNKLCIHQGYITNAMIPIICLPNAVTVEIISDYKMKGPAIDRITE